MAHFPLLCLSLFIICAWNPVQGLAVMSVDFGSEWMKIAIVSVILIVYVMCLHIEMFELSLAWSTNGNCS